MVFGVEYQLNENMVTNNIAQKQSALNWMNLADMIKKLDNR